MLTFTIWAACAVWLTFITWYTLRARWWKSDIGRNTFGVSACVFLILLRLGLLRITEFPDSDSVGVLFYSLLAFFGAQRLWFMERAQRNGA